MKDRLKAKLGVPRRLRHLGIWLLDTSIVGWYIAQPTKYQRTKGTDKVHKLTKERPPNDLKGPTLVNSWEGYTKHVIREAAKEGHLQVLVPIGREVEKLLTRGRIVDAVSVDGVPSVQVTKSFPAPNAWLEGGYGKVYRKISDVVRNCC